MCGSGIFLVGKEWFQGSLVLKFWNKFELCLPYKFVPLLPRSDELETKCCWSLRLLENTSSGIHYQINNFPNYFQENEFLIADDYHSAVQLNVSVDKNLQGLIVLIPVLIGWEQTMGDIFPHFFILLKI